jgi:adenylate cyclase
MFEDTRFANTFVVLREPESLLSKNNNCGSFERNTIDADNGQNAPAAPSESGSLKSSKNKLHLPGHRHTRSKEEPKTQDLMQGMSLRPTMSREDSYNSLRRDGNGPQFHSPFASAMSSKITLVGRPTSPTPSATGSFASIAQKSPVAATGKRSLMDRFRGKHKGKDKLPDMPTSAVSLQQPKSAREKSVVAPNVIGRKGKADSLVPKGTEKSGPAEVSKREHGLRPFKKHKEQHVERDPNEVGVDTQQSDSYWALDTNLNDMEGILGPPMTPPAPNDIFAGFPPAEENKEAKQPEPSVGAWEVPDSWGVKRIEDENVSRLAELDENGQPLKEENGGPPYRVRVFRADSTFAVLSVGLNTTVVEIVGLIGKKTFLQDELENYHVVMKKHDTSRQLGPQERPLVIQKRLLEQAGYTESDRIEDVGGEDNSYLCRFTFLPAKLTGYSSLEAKDPGFNKMQKFSHIDLQGRNLITIPITLYQKATEIISLNLSRNLNLDIPKDFIHQCTNLRELKYTSNEAWRLPPSMSLATRLTALDVSNNKLEQLEHAELHKLQGLVSLRLSNNKLTGLPKYFGHYKALRSLNLASNSLTEFPEYMCEIKTLVDLDISFNAISELPNIGNLTKLERLWATNNKLSGSFPPSTANLENVREIDIRHNALDSIDVFSQLSKLEFLYVGYNSISAFEGTFARIRSLHLNHNPVTRFGIAAPIPTLTSLNLEKAKLAALPDDVFQKASSLKRLNLDQNHFVSVSPHIGKLTMLEHFTIARNLLSSLPADIGRLTELRTLDLRENNLSALPSQIWFARRLETLNVSSNVLTSFPKPGAPLPPLPDSQANTPASQNGSQLAVTTPNGEDGLGNLEDFQLRRPSAASGYVSALGTSPNQSRKGSVSSNITQVSTSGSTASSGTRKPSMTRTSEGTITPVTRKDSSLSTRLMNTFAISLRHLFLADNRLPDEAVDELQLLSELRILNISYNHIYDLPQRALRRWPNLCELYLSGNDLTCLPSEDLEEISGLRVLHINNNKFQVLPAEIAKIQKLAIMDVGSNLLKYNVSNWPYDWNWNWNHNLKYLNLSGNKRLEIKPSASYTMSGRGGKDLTDFSSLKNLRVLGLMDVTLMVPSVPDQTDDRRVRTAGSTVGSMAYGMADSLGRNEHLSTMDMVIDRFRSHDDETILGMFDGQALSSGGSKIAKHLHESFKHRFADELDKLRQHETPADALRRTYLGLNKDIALAATQVQEYKADDRGHRPSISAPNFSEEDLSSGCVATVLFLKEMQLFVSNVGDATALLIHSEGSHKVITRKHDPTDASERQRIRDAGGFVSRHGKLNDVLEVSRAFGYVQFSPAVIAAPHVSQITIKDSDEMILIASRELWNYMTREFAVDVARQERGDLMRAAQKLRDLAIAFGATNKIMVMIVGVSDLRRKERARYRTHSMSMGPSGVIDDYYQQRKARGRMKDAVADSKLARLDQEVDAPTGEISLVFTDIKSSTLLWETYPIAMRSAIKMHNELMRRHLRIIGGYEVKTEGDAFMVAFPTVTSALLWCFTIQSELLNVPWPQEILSSVNGQEVCDADGNVIFRGLSVRMGIHWGSPVCEPDPVTKRMDYFGPMVNRASRISSVADGGQITVSSDFIAEIQRLLETHIESDRSSSTGSEDTIADDMMSLTIRRELRSLSSQGFEVKDLGERRLKGLENPEYIYLMYPHALSSRLLVQQQRAAAEAQAQAGSAVKTRDSQLTIDTENVWDLWNVSLRLEMLCSSLESPGNTELKAPETALLERMKERGGEITDRFLINFVEHQISRIEVSFICPA